MADEPMWTTRKVAPAVAVPPEQKPDTGDHFEIKRQFLSMIRELTFDEKVNYDPNQHVKNFLDICDLFKNEGTSDDAVKLRLFLFTLIGEAKAWMKSLEHNSITT